jgi:flagellin
VIKIGKNILAENIVRNLTRNATDLSTVFERLSSGQRINRASDDPAGLAIADSLRTDSRVLGQALRNINDGISAVNIASSAITSLSQVVTRMTELAQQSANGVYSSRQRDAMEVEFQALRTEYGRIAQSTTFNGTQLLAGGEISIQGGRGDLAVTRLALPDLSAGLGSTSGSGGTGSFATMQYSPQGGLAGAGILALDIDGDGDLDIARAAHANGLQPWIALSLNDGTGVFSDAGAINGGQGVFSLATADFNEDGDPDIVSANFNSNELVLNLGASGGTFTRSVIPVTGGGNSGSIGRTVQVGDFNGDSNIDIVAVTGVGDGLANILLGNGDGTFQALRTFDISGISTVGVSVAVLDFNRDGLDDVAFDVDGGISLFSSNGDGTFSAALSFATSAANFVEAVDINSDGYKDLAQFSVSGSTVRMYLSTGAGTFAGVQTATFGNGVGDVAFSDINRDGYADLVGYASDFTLRTKFGDGTGSFSADISSPGTVGDLGDLRLILADLNGDGVSDAALNTRVFPGTGLFTALSTTTTTTIGLNLSIATQEQARTSLDALKTVLEDHSTYLADLGATQSRLEIQYNTITTRRENYLAAESRIRDADIAEESANLVALTIRQQVATSLLAQANQVPALALRLLNR